MLDCAASRCFQRFRAAFGSFTCRSSHPISIVTWVGGREAALRVEVSGDESQGRALRVSPLGSDRRAIRDCIRPRLSCGDEERRVKRFASFDWAAHLFFFIAHPPLPYPRSRTGAQLGR